ncbi:MAG: hypothetical protein WA057_06020 [Candidatus Magasanikiibacteriota bacterium]
MQERRDKPLNRIILRHGKVCRIEEWVLRREHWWQPWKAVMRLLITSDDGGFELKFNRRTISDYLPRQFFVEEGFDERVEGLIRGILPREETERVVEAMIGQYVGDTSRLIELFPNFIITVLQP